MSNDPESTDKVPSTDLTEWLDNQVAAHIVLVDRDLRGKPYVKRHATILDTAERRALFNEREMEKLMLRLGHSDPLVTARDVNHSLRRIRGNYGLRVAVASGANDERTRLILFNEPHVPPRT